MKKVTEESQASLEHQVHLLKQELDAKNEKIAELERQKKRYEQAADDANDGLWGYDFRRDETFVSPPWRKMLGYNEEDIFQHINFWESLLHPEDKDRAVRAFSDYISGKKEVYNEEFRMLHKNGSYRWIHSRGTLHRDKAGKPLHIFGAQTDITESKFANQALKESEKKYRNLFQNSHVSIFRVHAITGELIEANNKAWEMVGIIPQKQINIESFFYNKEDHKKIRRKLRKDAFVDNMELQLLRSDGAILWASLAAISYEKENIVECVVTDISKTKENQFELQKLNDELDNFVYHASHDLRSPLRSILGLVEILRMETDEVIKDNCINLIESSINKLDDLVMDLLAISRNKRLNDPVVAVNLMQEINNSVGSIYNVSQTKSLLISAEIRQTAPFHCDATRLRIILNNLISNAIKYRRFLTEPSFIHIIALANEEQLILSIEDNGEGIPEDKISQIFDMFVRASESSDGSGLGLYIVKNVIEKMKGFIDVRSKYNVGTTFSVVIPSSPPQDS